MIIKVKEPIAPEYKLIRRDSWSSPISISPAANRSRGR